MYVSDAENAPYKKKKDSSTSHAEKRSDHEHYYAAEVTTVEYCDGRTFTYRRAVCIFCGRRARMSKVKLEKLEVYQTLTSHQHWPSRDHKREDCYYFNSPYRPRFIVRKTQ